MHVITMVSKDLSDSMDVVEEWNDYFDTLLRLGILHGYLSDITQILKNYMTATGLVLHKVLRIWFEEESMMTDEGLKIDAQFAKVSTCASHSL